MFEEDIDELTNAQTKYISIYLSNLIKKIKCKELTIDEKAFEEYCLQHFAAAYCRQYKYEECLEKFFIKTHEMSFRPTPIIVNTLNGRKDINSEEEKK